MVQLCDSSFKVTIQEILVQLEFSDIFGDKKHCLGAHCIAQQSHHWTDSSYNTHKQTSISCSVETAGSNFQ